MNGVRLRTFLGDKRGNIAVLTAITGALIVGTAGVAVDYARYNSYKDRLQNVADTASIAGLQAYLTASLTQKRGKTSAETAVQEAVQRHATTHIAGLIGAPLVTVSETPAAVEVKLSGRQTATLSRIWGQKDATISVVSRADSSLRTSAACVIALNTDASPGIEFKASGKVTARDCAIWSNSTQSAALTGSGAGSAIATRFCAVGGVKPGTTQFSVPPEAGCEPVVDPFAALSPPAAGHCTYVDFVSNDPSVALLPGVYCGGIRLQAQADVSLAPGNYILKDGSFTLAGGSTISGQGVTIFLTGANTGLKLGGAATLRLSAPTSGTYAGIAIFSDRSAPLDVSTLSGSSSLDIEGVVYLPNQDLVWSGSHSANLPAKYTILIARTVTFSGSSDITIASNFAEAETPIPGQLLTSRVSVLRTR